MVILGVADQPAPAAAVVIDDEPVALVAGEAIGEPALHDGVPWPVVEAALAAAGIGPEAVDVVALAGRFLEPLPLRARPRLRTLLSRTAAPLMELEALWQTALRRSGLGAWAADVTAEWVESRFRDRGFDPGRVVAVDAHKALAEAAYRLQPGDAALVVVLHPLGDGVALSTWRGRAGHLDRTWEQADAVSLHAHLARVDGALGLSRDARRRLGVLGARGAEDPDLIAFLAEDLRAEGRRLSRGGVPRPVLGEDPLGARLAGVAREDAAASAHANLVRTVSDLVRRHVRTARLGTVALAGDVFDDPRLVAAVAEVPGVEAVHVLPRPGRDALALGAAVSQAGLGPADRSLALGPTVDDAACARALDAAGLRSARRANLPDLLCAGEAVVRYRERPGPGAHGLGARCAFVRADDPVAVARLRRNLGRSDDEEPLCVVVPTPNEGAIGHLQALRAPLLAGAAAPRVDDAFRRRYPPVVAPDGRVWMLRAEPETHPGLHRVAQALLRSSGCGALAAFPLAEGDGPVVATPDEAVAVFRRAGAAALQLGSFYVERGTA